MKCATIDPHAQPWSGGPAGPAGVLLCHGFTGSPASMRPLAEFLADAGLRVELPRLPGHGTDWRELQLTNWTDWYHHVERSFLALARECRQVFVVGLSMGGALALRLAENHPVAGLVLVNPAIGTDDRSFAALGTVQHLKASLAAIGNDIAKPGVDEHAYPRTPLHAAHSMTLLWREVVRDLSEVDCDVLLFTSRVDHCVDGASARILAETLPRLERVVLERSHHVATLDHDADLIQQRSLAFVEAHRGTSMGGAQQ
ncbi:alpha/beta fold hydrolase [Luteococcus sp. H138]|uniref:alpha/beta hydrolase n=1 Tax=unclassified Luteococcus TaxID=2639923 RepID=UPI00313B35EC